MRAEEIADGRPRQLHQIFSEFALCVAPDEVGVGLRKSKLRQLVHDFGTRERFRQENGVRMARADIGDHPLPEREWLGMRIINAEDAHARVDPIKYDVTESEPCRRHGIRRVEIDVDNILVFLGGVLRIMDRTVGSPCEPTLVFLQPGMVPGTLHGEIECELQSLLLRGQNEGTEILKVSEVGMNCVVTALGGADRIGAPRILRLGLQRIVASLAVGFADGVDWRQVEDVKTHRRNGGQPLNNVA